MRDSPRRSWRRLDVRKADRPGAHRCADLHALDLDVIALTGAPEHIVERVTRVAERIGPIGNDDGRLKLHATSIAPRLLLVVQGADGPPGLQDHPDLRRLRPLGPRGGKSTEALGPVEDAGNANPDSNFRFDASLGGSGGYIYNLSTKGMSTGTWALRFRATGDPTLHRLEFQLK
jgi:hypothetical protein